MPDSLAEQPITKDNLASHSLCDNQALINVADIT